MSKTVLFGAMGRHNFGDMLMPHIVQKLIGQDCIVADLVESDMTEYGGHKVVGIDSLFDSDETVNLVLLGGEVGKCTMRQGMDMHGVWGHTDDELAYVLPKSRFKNPGVFVANSIGGMSPMAESNLADYDYVSVRDSESMIPDSHHVPDCVVMVRELFDDRIQQSSEQVIEMRESLGDYIAVQVSIDLMEKEGWDIYERLEQVIDEMDMPIVLFCAGIAPAHDSLEAYANEFNGNFMPGMVWYFDDYNIWSTCNVIANSKLFIGTSLHARIVASAYDVPRVSIGDKRKVEAFDKEWDNEPHDSMCRAYMSAFNEWSKLGFDDA